MDRDKLHPNEPGARFTSTSREYSNTFPNWNRGFDHLYEMGNEIISAHYAIDKPSHVNLRLIEHMRNRAIRYVKQCEQAILLGVHLEERPDADPCLFKILTELRKRVECRVPVTLSGLLDPRPKRQKLNSSSKF